MARRRWREMKRLPSVQNSGKQLQARRQRMRQRFYVYISTKSLLCYQRQSEPLKGAAPLRSEGGRDDKTNRKESSIARVSARSSGSSEEVESCFARGFSWEASGRGLRGRHAYLSSHKQASMRQTFVPVYPNLVCRVVVGGWVVVSGRNRGMRGRSRAACDGIPGRMWGRRATLCLVRAAGLRAIRFVAFAQGISGGTLSRRDGERWARRRRNSEARGVRWRCLGRRRCSWWTDNRVPGAAGVGRELASRRCSPAICLAAAGARGTRGLGALPVRVRRAGGAWSWPRAGPWGGAERRRADWARSRSRESLSWR